MGPSSNGPPKPPVSIPLSYAGHSLRAGLATQSYLNGAGELAIMRQTGHRSLAMVRRYIRDGSLFRENPARNWDFEVG